MGFHVEYENGGYTEPNKPYLMVENGDEIYAHAKIHMHAREVQIEDVAQQISEVLIISGIETDYSFHIHGKGKKSHKKEL